MGAYFIDFYIQLKFGIVGVVANYISAALIPILFLDRFNYKKLKSWAVLLLHILACVVIVQFICAVYYIWTSVAMPQICCAIVTILYALCFCKYSYAARFSMTISYISVIMNLYLAFFAVSDLFYIAGDVLEQYAVVLIILVTVVLCALYLRAFSLSKFKNVNNFSIVLISIVGIVNIAFWILSNIIEIYLTWEILIGLVLVVLLFSLYYIAYKISLSSSRREEQSMRVYRDEVNKNLMHMSKENIESLRKLRHELKNQYAYMQVLLSQKQYDKLEKYFTRYSEISSDALAYTDCGNDTLNAIIAIAKSKAKNLNVSMDCRIEVPPSLPVEDADLSMLITNLIDNALEYLEKHRNLKDGGLTVCIVARNSKLFIEVVNPVMKEDEQSAIKLQTNKKDSYLHGYGIKIVTQIVKKYNGETTYSVSQGKFIAKALLFF